MADYITSYVKYIFLDVVGFTKDRSVEAQAYIIDLLNHNVSRAIANLVIDYDKLILLPTGDGLCIALLEVSTPFDIHLLLAKEIISYIDQARNVALDPSRDFQVRIGINENVDNIVQDINGRRNVAGMGINMAQRIMNCADGGQILVGQMVYETLSGREKYIKSFREFKAVGKHDIHLSVFQYLDSNTPGLNIDVPYAFVVPTVSEDKTVPSTFVHSTVSKDKTVSKLSKYQAYYLAYCWLNSNYLYSFQDDPLFSCTSVILLHFLAFDTVRLSEISQKESRIKLQTWGMGKASFGQQYEYYKSIDTSTQVQLADLIRKDNLSSLSYCFKKGGHFFSFIFLNRVGRKKLREEWPSIVDEFSLI